MIRNNIEHAILGAVAGLVALLLDEILLYITSGWMAGVGPDSVLGCLMAGSAAGLVTGAAATLSAAGSRRKTTTFFAATFLIYGFAAVLRISDSLYQHGIGVAARVGATVFAVAAIVCLPCVLRLLVGRERSWLVFCMSALVVSVGLTVNANLFATPLSMPAALADLAIVGVVALLAAVVRLSGRPALAPLALSIVLAGLVIVSPSAWNSSGNETARSSPATDGRNLILIVIDTLRQDVFRSVVENTEEGREFHAEMGGAAWFSTAVSSAPWTAPSVASLMTGLRPIRHGLVQDPRASELDPPKPLHELSHGVTTLAERLRDNGYWTVAYLTNPQLDVSTGLARGFMEYDLLECGAKSLTVPAALKRLGVLECPPYETATALKNKVQRNLERLEAHDGRLFLWLHFMDPHAPLFPHDELPTDSAAQAMPEIDRLYRDEVRFTLGEVASIIRLLKSKHLWSESLVIVVADHGETLPSDARESVVEASDGTRMSYGHGYSMHRELLRVPLVVRPPGGLTDEHRVSPLVGLVDVFPTVTDLLGLADASSERAHRSMRSLIEPDMDQGENAYQRASIFSSGNNLGPKQESIRTADARLIFYPQGDQPPELYELSEDPWEKTNLASTRTDEVVRLEELISEIESLQRPALETDQVRTTPEQMERLRALGYVR